MKWRIVLALLLTTSVVHADPRVRLVPPLELKYVAPPLEAIPPGDDVITPVKKGEPAPYQGQLMDTPTALRWLHFLQQARLRLTEDVILERKVCNANLTYLEDRVVLEIDARKGIEKDLRARLLKVENVNVRLQKTLLEPGILQSPIFWFAAGVVLSGAVFGVSAAVTR